MCFQKFALINTSDKDSNRRLGRVVWQWHSTDCILIRPRFFHTQEESMKGERNVAACFFFFRTKDDIEA